MASSAKKLTYTFPKTVQTSRIYKKVKSCKIDALLPFITNEMLDFPKNLKFVHYLELALGVFLFIPKLVLFVSSLTLLTLMARIISVNLKNDLTTAETPEIVGWRRNRYLWILHSFFYRCLQFSFGIFKIEFIGKPCRKEEAAIAVCAPHGTFLDSALLVHLPFDFENLYSPLCIEDLQFLDWPIRPLMPVYVPNTKNQMEGQAVSRQDSGENTRSTQVLSQIRNRINSIKAGTPLSKFWFKILIFPEGSVANRTCIQSFQIGAFQLGEPVQPIYLELRHPTDMDIHTWSWIPCYKFPTFVLSYLMTFRLIYRVHFLPIFHPSPEEIANPSLYAENVRKTISEYSSLPLIASTTHDGKLAHRFSSKFGGDPTCCLVKTSQLKADYNIRTKEIYEKFDGYFETFSSIIDKKTGHIKLADFAHFLSEKSKMELKSQIPNELTNDNFQEISEENLKELFFTKGTVFKPINDRVQGGYEVGDLEIIRLDAFLDAYFRAEKLIKLKYFKKLKADSEASPKKNGKIRDPQPDIVLNIISFIDQVRCSSQKLTEDCTTADFGESSKVNRDHDNDEIKTEELLNHGEPDQSLLESDINSSFELDNAAGDKNI